MGKARKPSTTQKPPVPLEGHAEIDEWMRRVMPDLQPIVKHFEVVSYMSHGSEQRQKFCLRQMLQNFGIVKWQRRKF